MAQSDSASAESTVGLLASADETSATADIREPSGIAEVDTQTASTRTATTIARPRTSSSYSASGSTSSSTSGSTVSGTGWRSAVASWYGPGFYGNTMASGQILTETSMVVAHRTLPFGTRIEFSYHGRTCVAVVMDRGPYSSGRTFDLGPGTAKALGFSGVATVQYRIL
jgi:rare lipoprotein A (peptidoglycan hydrolase)